MTTLRQLEYLVAVVDTGSFTRAAELLHVTQPALSHQVRALEKAVGGTLLERLPRAVRLTPMGRAVLPHARAALADAERLRAAARLTAGLDGGELELATVYSVGLGILPPVLRAWRRDHPGCGSGCASSRTTTSCARRWRPVKPTSRSGRRRRTGRGRSGSSGSRSSCSRCPRGGARERPSVRPAGRPRGP
ncbi:LysR family transcriptional regulator [Kitasatospora aburaviensis]